jgi:tetratricopeptide (TPR) repeat protein
MRRAAFAALLLVAGVRVGAAQPREDRIAHVEQWLKAVMRHDPGTTDQSASVVASWSTQDVRTLWVDTSVVAQLMRDPRKSSFSVRTEGQATSQPVRYLPGQLSRLKALACVAAGLLPDPVCVEMHASTGLDAELLGLAAALRQQHDDNVVLRRGALLHGDIAMLMPLRPEPIGPIGLGPQRAFVATADGLARNMVQMAPHWELARMLLDHVRPEGGAHPAPGLDDMVRRWYRATAAWMQAREQHDTVHLNHARTIFPNDPDILYLSACQHETYAGPPIQSAVQSLPTATGVRFDVISERSELRQAEGYYRRALAARPSMAEAQLRYGRVLFLLERYADAIGALRQALASLVDRELRYDGELFLGAAETAVNNIEGARAAYSRAADLYPTAQSPRIALSQLARRSGDRGGALRELQVVFDRPANEPDADDPWWRYFVVQARNADELLEDLRRPFRTDPSR